MSSKLRQLERQVKTLTGPLIPLLNCPLPHSQSVPSLPPRTKPFKAGWELQTFIVPAAFPRSIQYSALSRSRSPLSTEGGKPVIGQPTTAEQKEKGRVDIEQAVLELYQPQVEAFQRQYDVESDKVEMEDQEQLWLVVNRYRPSSAKALRNSESGTEGVTLLFSHANGFHKEIWEPTISDLIDDLGDSDGPPVKEIWAWDCVNQGDSATVNRNLLGKTFYWADYGRDLLNLAISYITSPISKIHEDTGSHSSAKILPNPVPLTNLHQLDNGPNATSGCSPRKGQNLFLISHSFGAAASVYAGSTLPSLFKGMALVDPVLRTAENSNARLVGGALLRRDRWRDRTEAKEGFLKKPFFRAWEERVLESYVEFGLKEGENLAEGEVILKCPGKNEAIAFADPGTTGSRRAFSRLPLIPSSLPTHFIFADAGKSILSEEAIEQVLEHVPHSTHTRMEGGTHLVVQEMPGETAREIARFLRKVQREGE
ncbi:alpha/beta-hydrolase [Meredithblackwellia eburnea MCA 4105]